jgi:NADPH-dependent curcumin reductase CurA
MTGTIERIVLASRPVGEPALDNFRSEKLPIPHLGPNEILLRTLWLSLDPYMRGRMSDAPSYAKPVGIGDVMEGGTVSEVVASNLPRFAKGDIVVGRTGWQTHALSNGSGLQKVDPRRAPIQTALGVLATALMTSAPLIIASLIFQHEFIQSFLRAGNPLGSGMWNYLR